MRRFGPLIVLALAVLLAAAPASAAPVRTPHLEAELLVARDAFVPGASNALALRLAPIPDWHTYWRNPGDSGEPTSIEWELPAGWRAGPIEWPVPGRLPLGPLMNYGYDEVLLPLRIEVPHGASGTASVTAHARWLVCSAERCVPESGTFALTLPLGPGRPTPHAQAIAAARAALPAPAGSVAGWRLDARAQPGGAALGIEAPPGFEAASFWFFPFAEGRVHHAGAQPLAREGARATLSIPAALQPVGPLDRLHGLLVADRPLGPGAPGAMEIDVAVSGAAAAAGLAPAPTGPARAPMGLLVALAFAFAGGLLLNLMPCVLPVLSIKALGLAREAAPRVRRLHGLAYAAGVLAAFWLLAGALVALQHLGEGIGWGFQLQSPAVVALLALLFFALALNLSGVFEFGMLVPARLAAAGTGGGHAGAFFTGVLAVAIASPCTAPFMGAALGYALGASATTAFLVFGALGLGMALPYVALAWHPRLLARLPRPGAWMLRLKQVLAFPLYATVIWLVWVLGMQSGLQAVVLLLCALLALALALWLAGFASRRLAGSLALAFGALALGLALAPAAPRAPAAASGATQWAPWSAARVASHTAAGRPVFVDFTAAWCLTCQVNKQLVLSKPEVENAFRRHGVELLRADWTRRDEDIARALAELGRNGVPVYALYLPGQPVRLLPELLTQDLLFDALKPILPRESRP